MKYIIELWECVEVDADDKWEAIERAWKLYDDGELAITEATVVDVEDDE